MPSPLDGYDWEADADSLAAALAPLQVELLKTAWADAGTELGIDLAFDVANPAVQRVLKDRAALIKGITATTRDEIQALLGQAAAEGWTLADLAGRIRDLVDAPDASRAKSRAQTIARTESATAYNLGSLLAYGDAGVDKVQVLDSDNDEDCAAVDGAIWTLAQAQANPIAHPNCVRAFAPYLGD